jgi:hypothetical protein
MENSLHQCNVDSPSLLLKMKRESYRIKEFPEILETEGQGAHWEKAKKHSSSQH